MYESVYKNDELENEVSSDLSCFWYSDEAECQKVKDDITSNQFIFKFKQALMILDPLDRLIVKYQSDKVPISEVMPDFHALPNEFKMQLDSHIITQSEFE